MRGCAWVCTAAVAAAVRIAALASATEPQASSAVDAAVFLAPHDPDVILWEARQSETTARLLPDVIDNSTDGLLSWATQRMNDHKLPPPQICSDGFLVVGVKTRVVDGFHSRQIIRNTWANPHNTHKLHTRVVFLACQPDPEQLQQDMNHTLDALAMEKQVYGDLLTHELGDCVDSYHSLVEKVVGFYHWVSVHCPRATYVMTADDDVYVRLDRVVDMLRDEATPRVRYYAGQVTSVQFGRFVPTKRDPAHKNFVSEQEYPFSVHYPRAIGAHYLLSSDLVEFIARNRHDLHGIGGIEDLSVGFWLVALLQVHPIHLDEFDTIGVNICRNSLISYGDLSHHGIRQIHANLARGDPVCREFIWSDWINEGTKEPVSAAVYIEDIDYHWDFSLGEKTRAFRIDITVQVPRLALTLPSISFTPSVQSTYFFCDKFYREMPRPTQSLPPVRCDDLLNRLAIFLPKPPRINAALYALTKSNLPPLAGPSAEVNVWVSSDVVRWRALIESLMAGLFPDIHIFVFDEHAFPNLSGLRDLSFAVVSFEGLAALQDLPQSCRLIVLATSAVGPTHQFYARYRDHGVIWLSSSRSGHADPSQAPSLLPLYVPLVSMVFSDSLAHSPVALLHRRNDHKLESTPAHRYTVTDSTTEAKFLLTELQGLADCHGCAITNESTGGINDAEDQVVFSNSAFDGVFAFDTEVTQYAQSKFVLAFENQQNTPGYIAQTIVAAFLAGSVPIYLGDHATVSQLFNPNAFISCGRFPSLHDCAEYVKQVDQMPELYEAMRSEAPVVNKTAFYEAFSWHPDVLELLRVEQGDAFAHVDMIERLRDMINSV